MGFARREGELVRVELLSSSLLSRLQCVSRDYGSCSLAPGRACGGNGTTRKMSSDDGKHWEAP